MLAAQLLAAVCCAGALPRRLSVNGSQVLFPDGSPALLRGFDWYYTPMTPYGQYAQPSDGADIKRLLPEAKLIRSVLVHWYDDQFIKHGGNMSLDCYDGNANTR
jgi:hypothetical protein